jgi:hypothetical protein
VALYFEHAYALEYPSISDSLIIYISDDCGETWTRIWANGDDGSGNFATHPQTNEAFYPEVTEDWCGAGYGAMCNTVDITSWAGSPNIKIMFESYHYLGNNLFIDNITLTPYVAIDETALNNKEIQIYPNPSTGKVNLFLDKDHTFNQISILNISGQQILTENISQKDSNQFSFDLSDYPAGIYFVQLTGKNITEVIKLILK